MPTSEKLEIRLFTPWASCSTGPNFVGLKFNADASGKDACAVLPLSIENALALLSELASAVKEAQEKTKTEQWYPGKKEMSCAKE